MSKLYIEGIIEPLTITREDAEAVQLFWKDPSNRNDDLIDIENVGTFKKGRIKAVVIDELEFKSEIPVSLAEYYRQEEELRMKSPEEKFLHSWSHFKLFYYGIFRKLPNEQLRPRIREAVIKYFQENPSRTLPVCEVYQKILGLEDDTKISNVVARILQRVEERQKIFARTPTREWSEF